MRSARHGGLAAGLSLLLLLTACSHGKGGATTPSPSPSSLPRTASPSAIAAPPPLTVTGRPAPTDWLSDLESDGRSLYVTAHRCPGQVQQGACTFEGGLQRRKLGPRPVALWRYTDGQWVGLGRPGVDSDAELQSFRGGLLFVRWHPDSSMFGSLTGPLRVSVDEGRTWQDWPVPDVSMRCISNVQADIGPCTVVGAGSYVVVASNYGWVRRRVHSGGWDDITPPKRSSGFDEFAFGYGLLALSDGTLIATVNPVQDGEVGGHFLVLRPGSSTWSAPHKNPGGSSQVYAVDGSTVFATCWVAGTGVINVKDATSCGEYRTTDLQHWTRVAAPLINDPKHGDACVRLASGPSLRESAITERVGSLVYSITHVPYAEGHEAAFGDLESLDHPHVERHVLERSADSCRTWVQVLNAP